MSKHSSQMWENSRLNHYSKAVLALARTQPSAKIRALWRNLLCPSTATFGYSWLLTAARSESFTCLWHWEKESLSLFPCQLQLGHTRCHFPISQHPSRCCSQRRAPGSAALLGEAFVGSRKGTGALCGEGWGRGSLGTGWGACAIPCGSLCARCPSWHLLPLLHQPLTLGTAAFGSVWIFQTHVQHLLLAQCWEEDSQKRIYFFCFKYSTWLVGTPVWPKSSVRWQGKQGLAPLLALQNFLEALLCRALSHWAVL